MANQVRFHTIRSQRAGYGMASFFRFFCDGGRGMLRDDLCRRHSKSATEREQDGVRTFLRILNAVGFIVAGVSVLMDVGMGEVRFALFGAVGFVSGLLTFLLLNPNLAGRPTCFRTATIVWHWMVMAFIVLFGGQLLIWAALNQVWIGLVSDFTARALLVLYALFLAFAVWVIWRTIRMLRSDGRAEAKASRIKGGLTVPHAPGEVER